MTTTEGALAQTEEPPPQPLGFSPPPQDNPHKTNPTVTVIAMLKVDMGSLLLQNHLQMFNEPQSITKHHNPWTYN